MYLILLVLLMVFLYMTLFFIIAVVKKDNSLADIAWGGGFVLIALATFMLAPGYAEARQVLATCLVTLWGCGLRYIYISVTSAGVRITATPSGERIGGTIFLSGASSRYSCSRVH